MSRVHCSIRLEGKFFTLLDNNSSNGTHVNGERIKPNDPVQLRDGDEIVMGDMAKLGVKLIFPIFFCILPSLFLVTVGPVAMKIVRELVPMMTNL